MTDSPPLDTSPEEHPDAARRAHPTALETLTTWLLLGAGATVVNVVLLFIAASVGAELQVTLGGEMDQEIGWIAVVAMTMGAMLLATLAWSLVAHRVPAFAHLWVPLTWGIGLLSLGGVLGASGVATGVFLALMHLVTAGTAAHLLPRRLPH